MIHAMIPIKDHITRGISNSMKLCLRQISGIFFCNKHKCQLFREEHLEEPVL